ncbi:MAG TPA: hypothetical protein VMD92_13865 [Acidobacteriaceae bacterium]|nr:hypothetical protein [Acidobacteriaceae bacterium]
MQLVRMLKLSRPAWALALAGTLAVSAWGDSCLTQSQMTAAQREQVANAARMLVSDAQNGDLQGLRDDTLPSVAANFSGIANSAQTLRPLIAQAAITVDAVFSFDAAQPAAGAQSAQASQFFCTPSGSTFTVVLNFSALPPGKYALAIVHATGVPKPQQVSLILAQTPMEQWKLAGFFSKPLMLAGQNGVWYWSRAREFAQKKQEWAAYFYYQIASFLVEPADFLSSPNVEKLRREAGQVHPENLPGDQPVNVYVNGLPYAIAHADTSADLGPLDFVIRYNANPEEAAQLRDPVSARKQVVDLMSGLLTMHPGLREAFHGMWVYADSNGATLFALELPMNQIPGSAGPGSFQAGGR